MGLSRARLTVGSLATILPGGQVVFQSSDGLRFVGKLSFGS